ncbi:hypothetical protein PT974_00781 [Cladobotryum mycophilum]|uniref:DUF7580 domain-containing protein n=1 Tax=Cladobotryum mycophilum TaxID=491253 RepID=A0ABR0T2P0_9HYPO
MAGLEIAGLAFGVIPIIETIIKGEKGLSQRLKVFRESSFYTEQLLEALSMHQRTMFQSISVMLSEAGIPAMGTRRCDPRLLSDANVKQRILARFDEQQYSTYLSLIGASDCLIRRLVGELLAVGSRHRSTQESDYDLCSLVQHCHSETVQIDWHRKVRMRFAMKIGGLWELREEMRELSRALFEYTKTIIPQWRSKVRPTDPSQKGMKFYEGLTTTRRIASDIHDAVSLASKGKCHNIHRVVLFLDDRTFDLDLHVDQTALGLCSSPFEPVFETFYMREPPLASKSWARLEMTSRTGISNDRSIFAAEGSSTQQGVRTMFTQQLEPLTICNALNNISHGSELVILKTTAGRQLKCLITMVPDNYDAMVSLKDVPLRGNPRYTCNILPEGVRVSLALQVVSSTVQLYGTAWKPTPWSKDMLYFRPLGRGDEEGDARALIDFSRLHVISELNDLSEQNQPDGNSIEFRELGILLLEIWHATTLEKRFPNQGLTSSAFHQAAAERWLKSSYLHGTYLTIVQSCFDFAKCWDISWAVFCTYVLVPLKELASSLE